MRLATIQLVFIAGAVALCPGGPALGAPRVDSPHPPGQPYFEKYCFDCHDESAKGGLNLEALPADFSDPENDAGLDGGLRPGLRRRDAAEKKGAPGREADPRVAGGLKRKLLAAEVARRRRGGASYCGG